MILKCIDNSQVFLLGRLLNVVMILWVSVIDLVEILLNKLVLIFGKGLLVIDWCVIV